MHVLAPVLVFVFSFATYLLGYARGRKTRPRRLPPVQYHDPADFRCPRCRHEISVHRNWSNNHNDGCSIKTCFCELSQSDIWRMAEKWAITPPSTEVLLQMLRDAETPVLPEPKKEKKSDGR